ncbi:hypothetical protein O7602_00595 [Micromonospora sp. WMMD1128]|uniref:hypothetical protein n=1 Tax=Micromonospora sp. WMMD1128 TaxID=3015150 RepID=UPI00248B1A01|nr:hypothetical protein [Micromonospora sp. WMMD1128]WBB74098.1 hypothetical protein O7602_00595 [Micromonospora sp. WMMD1128]
MPASVAPADKRSPTLLTVLFWIGVGLAPLAALILLVADGNGTLRFGAVLAILAVVLIGLSIALRSENGAGDAVAEELREELEQFRRDLRAEIVAAAQRGNQALDQARRAEEAAGAVRRRLDAAAAGLAAAPADERPGGRARVPVAGAYEAGRSQPAGQDEDASSRPAGDRYGTDQQADPLRAAPHDFERPGTYPVEGRARPEPPGRGRAVEEHTGFGGHGGESTRSGATPAEGYRAEPARSGGHGAERPSGGVYGAARVPEPGARPEHRQVGLVHHTETVHVTTRHTIVDGGGGDAAGSRYGGYAGRWSPPAEDRHRDESVDHRAGHREAGRDDHPWPGRFGAAEDAWPGGLRSGAGAERPWSDARDGGPRDVGARPGPPVDGAGWSGGGAGWAAGGDGPDRIGGAHPWAGVGRAAGGGRGWASREVDDGWAAGHGRARPADEQRSGSGAERAGLAAGDRPEERPWPGWHDGPVDRHDGPVDRHDGSVDRHDGPVRPGAWLGPEERVAAGAWPEEQPSPGWSGPYDPGTSGEGAPFGEHVRGAPFGEHVRGAPFAEYGRGVPSGEHVRGAPSGEHGRAAPAGQYGWAGAVEPDGEHWSEMRAGNRWAAVHDDGQGRELRVGERRAAVHADGGGTEYRIEDRWAAVRGVSPGADDAGSVRHDPDPGGGWPGENPPALPSGGVPVPEEWRPPTQRGGQPEWRQVEPEWRQPEPEWQPEPDRQPEPEWRRPEPGGYGLPYRDTADRWR